MLAAAPSISVPVRDTAESAPGWRFLGEAYSCIPDAVYPWDPAVVRAIREFCPDVVPMTIRTVWKSSRLDGEPRTMVLVRHSIARAIRDPICPIHRFHCEMPSTGVSGVRLTRPNYIELNWYDKEVRPWGFDLPGEYLPFDWELYESLRLAYVDSLMPDELSEHLFSPYQARQNRRKKHNREERAYRNQDIQEYTSRKMECVSELEERDAALGEPEIPRTPSIIVP